MKPSMQAAALAAIFLCGCLRPDRFAGGTTDTGNAISASVRGVAADTSGRPIAGAKVRLRPADHLNALPGLRKAGLADYDGHTDSAGAFAIEDIDPGLYRLELAGWEGHPEGAGEDPPAIALALDLRAPSALPDRGLDLGKRFLPPTGTVTGTLLPPAAGCRAFVRAQGMERLAEADPATGLFRMRLPAGRYALGFASDCPAAGAHGLAAEVASGRETGLGTIDLAAGTGPYADWAHSARIALASPDTIPDGYPLLVRLESPAFPFAQARGDGRDARFSASDGSAALAFQIESWDSAAGTASIWVRLEGARDTAFRMHWGKADATPAGSGPAVFGRERFAGVWHLSEATGAGTFGDATGNGNAGRDTLRAPGDGASPGVAGGGHAFGPGSAGIRVADAPGLRFGAGDFALSAWARDAAEGGTRQILCKRTESSVYEIQVTQDGKAKGYVGRNPGVAALPGTADVASGAWHLLGLARKGDSLMLFRDGALDTVLVAKGMGDADNAADVFLGRDPGKSSGEGWNGELDEVRILRGAPSRAWMRLDHLTQSPGASALRWSGFR